MAGLKILVIESRPDIAAWLAREGEARELDLTVGTGVTEVWSELLAGRFDCVAGAFNGDGALLERLPESIRPKRIPLRPEWNSDSTLRVRWSQLLNAWTGHGVTVTDTKWLKERFDDKMDVCHREFIESLRPVMGQLSEHEADLSEHSRRVGIFAARIGRALGLPSEKIRVLMVGGLVHDVGKIRIDPETLNKPGALTDEEWLSIFSHPEWGVEIVEDHAEEEEILGMVRHHHERFDGKGYPHKLRAGEIPPLARVLALADAYDAVTHDRPYKKGVSHRHAVKEMLKSAGTQFDPDVVRGFLASRLDRVKTA